MPVPGYDVSPDGQTFVMVKRDDGDLFVTAMRLVLDWDIELENRVRPD